MSIFDLDTVAPNDFKLTDPAEQQGSSVYFDDKNQSVGDPMSCVGKLSSVKVLPSGWGFGTIRDGSGNTLSVCGHALAGLQQGGTYSFAGRLAPNGKYGPQLKLDSAGLHIPANRQGMIKFLTANYKGLGAKSAEKIVSHYEVNGGLEGFRAVLLRDPLGFDFSQAGVKRKMSMKASDGPKGLIYIDLATKVGGVDIGDKLLRKLAAHLADLCENAPRPVERAWQMFSSNPYAPIRDLSGYAFRTADALAMKIGFDRNRVERLAALATHAIAEGCTQSGHTYLTEQDFAKIIAYLDPDVSVMASVEAAIQMDEPIVIDDGKFYSQATLEAEMSMAKKVAWRDKRFSQGAIFGGSAAELDRCIAQAQKSIGIELDETQIAAVRGLLTAKASLHTITAGPGCGKTTIMEVVVQVIKDQKKLLHVDGKYEERAIRIGFCAPTGKAAKVLNGRIGRFGLSASTIHSLLGVKGEGGFIYNRFNKLDFDLLVVDETSMVDLALANALMDAVDGSCHMVFLGDDKQLPSVGPGSVLADLLRLPLDHYRLSVTHRNKGGILDVVNLAGQGMVDFRERDDVRFYTRLPDATAADIDRSVIAMYEKAVASVSGDFSKVGLLIARRKGDVNTPGWNVTYLNAVLRERYNPATGHADWSGFGSWERRREVMAQEGRVVGLAGEKIPGTRFRSGDRIIVRKNIILTPEPEEGQKDQVVNGDTGFLRDFWMGSGQLVAVELELDDGRKLALPSGDMDVLDFAYAMTVHAAQGSEYERVIFVCVNGTPGFVHRGIVFTAFSRAKKTLQVLGDQEAVKQVVARPMPKRNTHLVQRFALELKT